MNTHNKKLEVIAMGSGEIREKSASWLWDRYVQATAFVGMWTVKTVWAVLRGSAMPLRDPALCVRVLGRWLDLLKRPWVETREAFRIETGGPPGTGGPPPS